MQHFEPAFGSEHVLSFVVTFAQGAAGDVVSRVRICIFQKHWNIMR